MIKNLRLNKLLNHKINLNSTKFSDKIVKLKYLSNNNFNNYQSYRYEHTTSFDIASFDNITNTKETKLNPHKHNCSNKNCSNKNLSNDEIDLKIRNIVQDEFDLKIRNILQDELKKIILTQVQIILIKK